VPTRLVFTSSQTFTHDFTMSNDPDEVKIFDTFKDFPFQLLPHESYNVRLYAQDDSSGSYNLQGTATLPVCFSASCNGFTPDFEPGQTKDDIQTSIVLDNKTNQTFPLRQPGSTSGYHLRLDASGGITVRNESSTPANIIRSSQTLTDHMSLTIDYKGTLTLDLYYDTGPTNLTSLPCVHTNTPSTRPFFQAWGGDINTGGEFESTDASGAFTCSNSYPNYVSPATTGDHNSGGIKAFGSDDGTYGSLSDFAALSLGIIAKKSSSYINFGAQPSFANTTAPSGQLNSGPPNYCIKDFFTSTRKDPSPRLLSTPPDGISDLTGSSTGQYIVSGQNIDNFRGGTVNRGQRITLYLDGEIHITGNIIYADWDPVDIDTAPSLAIIVRGNINIDPSVTRLDGLYIAQPTNPGKDGEFNTCANNVANQFCSQQFVANGAVIARQILPLRSVGTLSPDANPSFIPQPGHNPAEIFNYIPAMVLTQPNFNQTYTPLEGLFNLPPVF
jgi:hypothetical protein